MLITVGTVDDRLAYRRLKSQRLGAVSPFRQVACYP